MISTRHMLDHLKDLLEDAFGEQARLRRYTRDEYPDTKLGVQCHACPWNNTSGYDTNRIINEAFLTSETYPNAWVDLVFVDDGTIYTSLYNGKVDKR